MDYFIHIIIFILIYAVLAASLNVILGYGGMVSMCHAVFFAIGAYAGALISINLGLNFLVGMVAGSLIAGVSAAIIALPSLRVRDEYIIVFTLAFQMVMYGLMVSLHDVTRGAQGIPGIPHASIFGIHFESPLQNLILISVIAGICLATLWRLCHSPFARTLKAIREDPDAAQSLGKNALKFKVLTFAIGGATAAMVGSCFAYYITFITPYQFTIGTSILLLCIVVIGGGGNFWGAILGATILVGLPEVLRFVPGNLAVIDILREIIYGALLVIFMCFRPKGVLAEPVAITKAPVAFKPVKQTGNGDRGDCPSLVQFPSKTILEVKGGSKSFGGLRAVKNASLTLAEGKITAIVGPNGCGKTTLFNLISGFLRFDAGKVYLWGKNVTGYPPYRFAKIGVGRSWQDTRIFLNLSVLENVMVGCPEQAGESLPLLFLSPRRVAKEEKENCRKAMTYLDLVGLSDKADQRAGDLSSAEQKVVAMARLLAWEYTLLFLDEPTSGMDPESVKEMMKLIQQAVKDGKRTVCLVEHNLDVVRGIADYAYFMDEGQVIASGTPAELMANPKLTEVYFGT